MIFSAKLFAHSQRLYEQRLHFIQFFSAAIEIGELSHGICYLQALVTGKLLQLVYMQLGIGDYFIAHSPFGVSLLGGRAGRRHESVFGTENRNAIGAHLEPFVIIRMTLLVALFLLYMAEFVAKLPDYCLGWLRLCLGYGESIIEETLGLGILALAEIDVGYSSQNLCDLDATFSVHGCLQF